MYVYIRCGTSAFISYYMPHSSSFDEVRIEKICFLIQIFQFRKCSCTFVYSSLKNDFAAQTFIKT